MAAPRASAARLDLLTLLQQAMTGMFAPQREDGLKALSVRQQRGASIGPNPYGLYGQELVNYWSSLDAHTPDKMNFARAKEIAAQAPGSPFAAWLGSVTGGKQGFAGGAAYNAALGQGGGGGGGLNLNSPWVNPAAGLKKLFG